MSPTLWQLLAAIVFTLCLAGITLSLRRQPLPGVLLFVVYALFFRFVLSAFHTYTFPPIAGPFSINALYSIAVIGAGLLIINQRLLLLRFLLPIHLLILLTLVSALYNGTLTQSVQSLVKWLFFIVIALAIYESLLRTERTVVLEKLLLSFSVPIVLQWLSLILGYRKFTELDQSVSYLGGYNHESVFSVMLMTAFCLAVLRQLIQPASTRFWHYLPLLLIAGIVLTNYRTTILGMLLPAGGYLWFRFVNAGHGLTRVLSFGMLVAGLLALSLLDLSAFIDRFSDIGTVMEKFSTLLKPPQYYTDMEQKYFSARLYIWSQYIDGYLRADPVQYLIGMGADTWNSRFLKYAHNTFIGNLYELGLLGVGLLGYFFIVTLVRTFSGPLTTYSVVLFLSQAGFLVMNLGTMPLWQIEGMILFAVLTTLVWERNLRAPQSFLPAPPHPSAGPRLAALPSGFAGATVQRTEWRLP